MSLRRRPTNGKLGDQEEGSTLTCDIETEENESEFLGAPLSADENINLHKEEASLLSLPEASVVYAVLLGLGFLLILGSFGAHYRLPPPREANSPPFLFSEERARIMLQKLLDIGFRWSGTKACDVKTVKLLLTEIENIRQEHLKNKPFLFNNNNNNNNNENNNNNDEYVTDTFEVDIQRSSGSFYLSFLNTLLTNSYSNITNIVIRLPANSARSSNDIDHPSLLLNSHFDSGLQATGGSDAGSGVVVILEVLRNLLASKVPRHYDLIILLNGAEEALLCGSNMFSTQHKWAKSVRAVINLEAVGAGGQEVIFQVNNEALSAAYCAAAPYPHGAVLAQEVFSSGIIPSDTDFRIFRDELGIPGIDMAFYTNGYVYHTVVDDLQAIDHGSLQHMGENVLAVAQYLLNEDQSDGILKNIQVTNDNSGNSPFSKPLDFFDFYGFIVYFPHAVTRILNPLVFVLSLVWVIVCSWHRPGGLIRVVRTAGAVLCCAGSAITFAIVASAFVVFILRTKMFFYANRWLGFATFGFPALLGMAIAVRFFVMQSQRQSRSAHQSQGGSGDRLLVTPSSIHEQDGIYDSEALGEIVQEHRVLDLQHFYWLAIILLCTIPLGVLSVFDLGSAGLFMIWELGLVGSHAGSALYSYYRWKCEQAGGYDSDSDTISTKTSLLLSSSSSSSSSFSKTYRLTRKNQFGGSQPLDWLQFRGLLWSKSARVVFLLIVGVPMVLTLHLWFSVFELVVPTLGRSGVLVPSHVVMAVFVAIVLLVTILPAIPFLLAAGNITTVIRILAVLAIAGLLASLLVTPYDTRHPRRLFIQHVNRLQPRNAFLPNDIIAGSNTPFTVDTGDHFIVMATLDPGPDVHTLLPPEFTIASPGNNNLKSEYHNVYPFADHLIPPVKVVGLTPPSSNIFSSGEFEHVAVVILNNKYNEETDTRDVKLAVHMHGFEYVNMMIDNNEGVNQRLLGWSMGEELPPTPCGHYFIRHINGYGSGPWELELTIQGKDPINVNMNGAHFTLTEALSDLLSQISHDVSPISFYVENSEWLV